MLLRAASLKRIKLSPMSREEGRFICADVQARTGRLIQADGLAA